MVLAVLSLCISIPLIVALPVHTPGAGLIIVAGTMALTFGAGLVIVVALALTDDVVLERLINGPINWLLRIGAPRTGSEAMLGTSATLIEAFDNERRGRVDLHGETWNARLVDSVPPPQVGTKLTVLEVQGLSLTVGPVTTESKNFTS
jgi:membrane protein implicated in regulation of membrane protease activity